MTQITANLTEKTLKKNSCYRWLTKKRFGHYALLKIFPSDHQEDGGKLTLPEMAKILGMFIDQFYMTSSP